MNARIGLVHATLAAVEPMAAAFRREAPEVALLHFLDEGLLPLVGREGLSPGAVAALAHLVDRAIASSVDAVLLTCSSYSPAVPALREKCARPVVGIDEAMLRQAVAAGPRIAVVATVPSAGPTTEKLLLACAAEAGREIEVQVALVGDAFAALQRGDAATHDERVRACVAALVPACDVIVLAQISMARAVADASDFGKPVLTSPRSSVRAVLARIGVNPA